MSMNEEEEEEAAAAATAIALTTTTTIEIRHDDDDDARRGKNVWCKCICINDPSLEKKHSQPTVDHSNNDVVSHEYKKTLYYFSL